MDTETLFPDWSIPSCAHHNVRVICDQEGLTWNEKQELTATVFAESEFEIGALNYNYAFHADGTKYVSSIDFGICQWNNYWHEKEISSDDALHDPDKAVRLMCAYWKKGEVGKRQWCAYANGRYNKYLGKV